MRARKVSSGKYPVFLKRSDGFYAAAVSSSEREDWDVAVSNAVQAGISMADALTVWFLGLTSAGQDHNETLRLLQTLPLDKQEIERNTKHLSNLLDVKGDAQYEDRSLKSDDSRKAIEQCSRFRSWGTNKLPK